MTLWEINDNIRKAIEQGFDEETGEIFDASDLEALQIQRDEKIESIALYIKDLTAEAYRKSQTVEFIDGFDVNQLPEQYQRKVDPEADKTALKDALKAGEEIYGVYLAEHNNTIIK